MHKEHLDKRFVSHSCKGDLSIYLRLPMNKYKHSLLRVGFISAVLTSTVFADGHSDHSGDTMCGDDVSAKSAQMTSSEAEADNAKSDVKQTETVGFLTAQGGGVQTLELSDEEIAELADGVIMGLKQEVRIEDIKRDRIEEVFTEASARMEAVSAKNDGESVTVDGEPSEEAEASDGDFAEVTKEVEIPDFSEKSLETLGVLMVLQSGLEQLGFDSSDAEAIRRGFVRGAKDMDANPMEVAQSPEFQDFIQKRIEVVQKKLQAAQAEEQERAVAEFKPIVEEWGAKEDMNVVLETTQGAIELELYPSKAPLAVANFVGHIEDGYYDGLTFHRVIESFMIQGGDPEGTGTGGDSIWGKPFPDEYDQSLRFDEAGMLAMANSGPMTNGSQFFITTGSPVWLNERHTIFGKVVEGYENVQKIENVETGDQDKPVEPQRIEKAYVKK